MADCKSVTRTNYFRVTDEKRYEELVKNLISTGYDKINHTPKTKEDGTVLHSFSAEGDIEFVVNAENEEYDFDFFLDELQKILPEGEAFTYICVYHEKCRFVDGYVIVVTKDESKTQSLTDTAAKIAAELTGNKKFEMDISY